MILMDMKGNATTNQSATILLQSNNYIQITNIYIITNLLLLLFGCGLNQGQGQLLSSKWRLRIKGGNWITKLYVKNGY